MSSSVADNADAAVTLRWATLTRSAAAWPTASKDFGSHQKRSPTVTFTAFTMATVSARDPKMANRARMAPGVVGWERAWSRTIGPEMRSASHVLANSSARKV